MFDTTRATFHTSRFGSDEEGYLIPFDSNQIPFSVRRFFVVKNVPVGIRRGQHAHLKCHQLLVAISGSIECLVHDGNHETSIILDSPCAALHLPPMHWGGQISLSEDSILGVFASEPYDRADYIEDFSEFIKKVSLSNSQIHNG